MKKVLSLVLVLAMVLCMAACGSSSSGSATTTTTTTETTTAAEPIHLSLGHSNNTEHHYQTLAESFKSIVEEKTNGAIVIDIYPAEQLGSGSEMLEYVIAGTQDIVLGPDAYLANYDSWWNLTEMPFCTSGWDQVKAIPGSHVAEVLEQRAEDNIGVKVLGWAANGMRIFSTKTPVNTPEDLSGLKIRAGSAKLINSMLTALNANATTASMSEVYSLAQTGGIDGQENPAANIIGYKFYEVMPYISVTHHQYAAEPMVMNLAKFNGLTEEQQQILLDAAAEVCAADVEYCSSSEEDDLAYMEEQGATIIYPDTDAFKTVMEPVVEEYCNEYGEEFTALLEEYKALG